LRIYIYEDGLVRFCSEKYSSSTNKSKLKNRFQHLTNFQINKKSKKFKEKMQDEVNNEQSCIKWSIKKYKSYLDKIGIDSG
jgi:tubulin polyglutamylase TTLL4